MINISKRNLVRIITFVVALVLVLAGVSLSGYSLASRYRSTIEIGYQQALNEFSDYITNVQSALTKGEYANTHTSQYNIAVQMSNESAGAKTSLSRLPLTYGECEKLQKYLSQVGDFANYIVAKLSKGETLSTQDVDSIKSLKEYGANLSKQVEDMASLYATGEVFLGQEKAIETNLENVNSEIKGFILDKDFEQINKEFEDYPSLVYDGPFADQIQQKKPRFLKGKKMVSKEDARKIASDFLKTSKKNIVYKNTREGNMPCYIFSDENIYISVTMQGGYVEEMYKNTQSNTQVATENSTEIELELVTNVVNSTDENVSVFKENNKNMEFMQAVEKGKAFLKDNGYNNMVESYYVTNGNICTINFAKKQGDVLCYSDLIKVGVDVNTGEIESFNAQGYIMNNYKRDIPEPKLKLVDVQLGLSERLKYEKYQLCMIPTGGAKEIFCYEIKCKGEDNERILVYVNAETGEEENILILLQADGGTLVI